MHYRLRGADSGCKCLANYESLSDRGISFRTKIVLEYRGSKPIELLDRGNEPVEIMVGAKKFRMAVVNVPGKATRAMPSSKHFALVRPDLHRLSDNTSLEQLQELV